MSCNCDINVNNISEFPFNDYCVIAQQGYSTTEDKSILNTFGTLEDDIRKNEEIVFSDIIVTLDTSLLNNFEMKALQEWYFKEINGGKDEFLIDIPIFGIRRKYKAKVINNLNESDFTGSLYRKVQLKILILDYTPKFTECDLCN